MLTGFFDAARSLFIKGNCEGCIARDYHILTLKEELRTKDIQLSSINQLYFNSSNKLIEHLTGINKIPRASEGPTVPIQHVSTAVREKIRQAEQKDAHEVRLASEKRQKEQYNERIKKEELNNVQGINSIQDFKTEVAG